VTPRAPTDVPDVLTFSVQPTPPTGALTLDFDEAVGAAVQLGLKHPGIWVRVRVLLPRIGPGGIASPALVEHLPLFECRFVEPTPAVRSRAVDRYKDKLPL
jgi:hypothetical protein